MGDRAQVYIKDEGVYLYTHWGGHNLLETVQRAINRHERWDDPEYLARIIFCTMIGNDTDSETGFGIGSGKHGDIWRLIEVDCENQRLRVMNTDDMVIIFEGSFTEFLQFTEAKEPFE